MRDPGDFRAVQGAITVDGLGNLLSGLAGTTPNTATTVGASVTELTGVDARSVGWWLVVGRCDRLSRLVTAGRTYPAMVCSRPHARERHNALARRRLGWESSVRNPGIAPVLHHVPRASTHGSAISRTCAMIPSQGPMRSVLPGLQE